MGCAFFYFDVLYMYYAKNKNKCENREPIEQSVGETMETQMKTLFITLKRT